MSPEGILAYGYNLGGADVWEIEQAGAYGEWDPPWADDLDFIGGAEKALLAADTGIGIELHSHGSNDSSDYLLAAHQINVEWSDAREIDFVELDQLRVAHDWDGRLRRALEILAITPKQAAPAWLLTSRL